ncbi:hypothetical protein ACNKHS_20275 [Shigella flexneri]
MVSSGGTGMTMVSPMVRLKNFNSQKPQFVHVREITLPEPTAITISSGLTPGGGNQRRNNTARG